MLLALRINVLAKGPLAHQTSLVPLIDSHPNGFVSFCRPQRHLFARRRSDDCCVEQKLYSSRASEGHGPRVKGHSVHSKSRK